MNEKHLPVTFSTASHYNDISHLHYLAERTLIYNHLTKKISAKSSIKSKNKNYKKVGEGKEERRKTICEEYYGFKN